MAPTKQSASKSTAGKAPGRLRAQGRSQVRARRRHNRNSGRSRFVAVMEARRTRPQQFRGHSAALYTLSLSLSSSSPMKDRTEPLYTYIYMIYARNKTAVTGTGTSATIRTDIGVEAAIRWLLAERTPQVRLR